MTASREESYGGSNIAGVSSGNRSRRMLAILEIVSERGSVDLAELGTRLSASPATLRRDLAHLAEQQLLIRTHGGASSSERGAELPVALRDTQHQAAKRAIARAVPAILPLQDRHVVALSGGTTTAHVARQLAYHSNLTVVTNSLTVAGMLADHHEMRVMMTGGFLRHPSLELVGGLAEAGFNAVNIGTAILGAAGVCADAGVTTHDETEARTNHAMAVSAQRTVVVADGSKIGNAALARMVEITDIQILITDSSADPTELEKIGATGVEVVVADDQRR
ncbi:DeoR/GlpR family DNA-binding transcription regulator [Microlunatus sp. Gsoil 973]|uniref:DeoR/GlpR family DNA-binding transcription regulator n=1 Tax=Microlunatus sp. Gsoil 973 TaxID=2672569 RepID=UPI001E417FD2|nr:DeoR/GlpR family DNA-binding transcription regulator [Microlunatus sp. Gsoil 973]